MGAMAWTQTCSWGLTRRNGPILHRQWQTCHFLTDPSFSYAMGLILSLSKVAMRINFWDNRHWDNKPAKCYIDVIILRLRGNVNAALDGGMTVSGRECGCSGCPWISTKQKMQRKDSQCSQCLLFPSGQWITGFLCLSFLPFKWS